MKPIIFENLRRLMGGGRKKKDKEKTSFKRSDSFKRISIRKSYLDRGKKKHLQKLEVATQTVAEDVISGKVDSSIQVDRSLDPTGKSAEKSVTAYSQWVKSIRPSEPPSAAKGAERTVIYIPASSEGESACPVIRQLSSSPTLHKKSTLKLRPTSPILQRKESNDSAVEVFPWGDCADSKKSPLIRRKSRAKSPQSLLPESGAEEMCSLSISLGRIWMDAPQGMAPRSLELPRIGVQPLPAHHSLDSALKDRKEDPIKLLKKTHTPRLANPLPHQQRDKLNGNVFEQRLRVLILDLNTQTFRFRRTGASWFFQEKATQAETVGEPRRVLQKDQRRLGSPTELRQAKE
uniref:Uncharacterized protein n=1 Tax=Photinus pyralis TaxID=7054 RepID=A0A1Y1LQ43_PHOPY